MSERKRMKKILVLKKACMPLVSSSSLSWAVIGDDATPAEIPLSSELIEPDATSWLAMSPDEAGYLIGPGDVLDISVWKDEALTRSCVVRPDGFISFPLVGDVLDAGKTPPQLKAMMEERLTRY